MKHRRSLIAIALALTVLGCVLLFTYLSTDWESPKHQPGITLPFEIAPGSTATAIDTTPINNSPFTSELRQESKPSVSADRTITLSVDLPDPRGLGFAGWRFSTKSGGGVAWRGLTSNGQSASPKWPDTVFPTAAGCVVRNILSAVCVK